MHTNTTSHPVASRPASGGAPIPWWMLVATMALVVFSGLAFWPWPSMEVLSGVIGVCFALRLALEAWTFWWASLRPDMPARMRQMLRLMAGVGSVSVLVNSSEALAAVGPTLLPQAVRSIWVVLSFAFWVGGLFWYPRRRSTHGMALLVTDILITLAGYGTAMVLMVTLPSLTAASSDDRLAVLPGAITQLLMLVGLNVLILRGVAFPSRRAFWCLVAGLAAYIPGQVINQLENAHVIGYGWSATAYFLGVVPEMAAAYFMRFDAVTGESRDVPLPWYAELNPLPLSAAVSLGIFLLSAGTRGPSSHVLPLSVALVVACALLVVRAIVTGRDMIRLVAEEAAREGRVEQRTLDAVGRLAGGIAHEFNNAMTVVIGSAELGANEADDPAVVRDSFAQIRDAGTRVATITARLQASTGRRILMVRPANLRDVIGAEAARLRSVLPPHVQLDASAITDVGLVPVDQEQVTMLLDELVANAAAALGNGGTLRLALSTRTLAMPFVSAVATLPTGRYVALTVSDTGRGVPTPALPKLFEPYFSTKDFSAGSGLGLAVVRGVVLAHHGGITIESSPRLGTTITVMLPVSRHD